jgi:hypothetical protein
VIPLPEISPDIRPSFCWVASYPKSGSTWLRLFLSAYFWGKGKVDINGPKGRLYGDLNERAYGKLLNQATLEDCRLTPEKAMTIRPAALFQLSQMTGGDAYIKTHSANTRVMGCDQIPEYLTRGAIYVIRDPRSVLVSFAKYNGETIDQSVERMNDANSFIVNRDLLHYLSDWSSHVLSWENTPFETHIVRYEDMVQKSQETFEGIVRFLTGDKEPNPSLLAASLMATRLEAFQAQEEVSGFRENKSNHRFFGSGLLEGWKDVLSEAQAAKIVKKHHTVMSRYNYL